MCDLKYQSKSHFVIIKALDHRYNSNRQTSVGQTSTGLALEAYEEPGSHTGLLLLLALRSGYLAGLPGHPSHLRQGLGRTRPYLVRPTSAVGSCPPRDGSPANSTETPALIHYERELTARDCHCNFLESSDNRLMGILLS